MTNQPILFEAHDIRRFYDKVPENFWFSVVEVRQLLTQHRDYQTACKYWYNLP